MVCRMSLGGLHIVHRVVVIWLLSVDFKTVARRRQQCQGSTPNESIETIHENCLSFGNLLFGAYCLRPCASA